MSHDRPAFPVQFGRYTLLERMAVGGMAEVFRAKITSSHGFEKMLVIKRILPHLAADPTFVSMFIDEAKLTAHLSHQKIVQTLDFGEVTGQYFIALELIQGFDALWLLRTCAHGRMRIPAHLVVFLIGEVLDALDYAHGARHEIEDTPLHIVHRDISPSNIFISNRGEVKLGDFGIASARRDDTKPGARVLKGKYGYMSPEQLDGRALDARSDLFAVGVVMAEMLMARRLFAAKDDQDVMAMVRDVRLDRIGKYCPDLHPALDSILRRALRAEPGERYQGAGEFRDQLTDYLYTGGLRVGPSDLRDFLGQVTANRENRAAARGPRRRPTMLELARDAATAPANYEALTVVGDGGSSEDSDDEGSSAPGFTPVSTAADRARSRGLPWRRPDPEPEPGGFVSAVPNKPPETAGSIGATSPMRVLSTLAMAHESGLVRFEASGAVREIFLLGGSPQAVSSNLPGESFADYLVAKGVLDGGDVDLARSIAPRHAGNLGNALVALGSLPPLDVFRLRSRQVRESVIDVLRWTEGSFAFYRDVTHPNETFPLGLDTFEILGAGATTFTPEFLYERFASSLDHRPVMTAQPRIEPEAFKVGPTPREVREMLDGKRALRSWIDRFGGQIERLTLLRSLYLLVETDLAELGSG